MKMTRSNILHKRYCFEVYDDVTYSCPFHIPHQTLSIHLNQDSKERDKMGFQSRNSYAGKVILYLNKSKFQFHKILISLSYITIQCFSFVTCASNSSLNKFYDTQQKYLIIFFLFSHYTIEIFSSYSLKTDV